MLLGAHVHTDAAEGEVLAVFTMGGERLQRVLLGLGGEGIQRILQQHVGVEGVVLGLDGLARITII